MPDGDRCIRPAQPPDGPEVIDLSNDDACPNTDEVHLSTTDSACGSHISLGGDGSGDSQSLPRVAACLKSELRLILKFDMCYNDSNNCCNLSVH